MKYSICMTYSIVVILFITPNYTVVKLADVSCALRINYKWEILDFQDNIFKLCVPCTCHTNFSEQNQKKSEYKSLIKSQCEEI